jgi:hypothetical protein
MGKRLRIAQFPGRGNQGPIVTCATESTTPEYTTSGRHSHDLQCRNMSQSDGSYKLPFLLKPLKDISSMTLQVLNEELNVSQGGDRNRAKTDFIEYSKSR